VGHLVSLQGKKGGGFAKPNLVPGEKGGRCKPLGRLEEEKEGGTKAIQVRKKKRLKTSMRKKNLGGGGKRKSRDHRTA